MDQDDGRERQEQGARYRSEPVAISAHLLVDHESREGGHPPQLGHAGGEHEQHECPAAPQAEHPVPEPQTEPVGHTATVVLEEVRRRVPALGEAPVLQGRELKRAGQGERGGSNQPRMLGQPGRAIDQAMDPDVLGEGDRAERSPHPEIPAEEARHRRRGPFGSGRGRPEESNHRQAGGKHHCDHHDLPGQQEQREGQPHWGRGAKRRALDQGAVIQERGPATGLGDNGQHPGAPDGQRDGHRDAPRLPNVGRCDHLGSANVMR